jgi:hypothetical protein
VDALRRGEREDELVLAESRRRHVTSTRRFCPGECEVHLFDDRRPELYGDLVEESRPVHVH